MAEIVRAADIWTSKTYVVVETEIKGLISHAGFRIRNIVRQYRTQLRFISIRTPWLPPCVLYISQPTVCQFCTSKSSDGGSQAERAHASRRRRPPLCTISRLSHMAWEVRVSAAPDFRLTPSLESGSLIFCRLGRTICQRTDPIKTPSNLKFAIHKPSATD